MQDQFSAAYQMVTCADCGAHYQCTPSSDYYHRPDILDAGTMTLENGACFSCLLSRKPEPSR